MRTNRSMPPCTVIPELAYPDVAAAADWLCATFEFQIRIRIGNHRVQLKVGDGCMVVVERPAGTSDAALDSVMVRVENVDQHFLRIQQRGAQVIRPPETYPYGERQYTVVDPGGHHWTFSQSVNDVDPATWGGEVGEL